MSERNETARRRQATAALELGHIVGKLTLAVLGADLAPGAPGGRLTP